MVLPQGNPYMEVMTTMPYQPIKTYINIMIKKNAFYANLHGRTLYRSRVKTLVAQNFMSKNAC